MYKRQLQNSAAGFDFPIGGLNPNSNYNVSVAFCFATTDGTDLQCENTMSTIVINTVACPNPVSLTTTIDSVSFSFAPSIIDGDYNVYLTQGGAPAGASINFTNPAPNPMTGTFNGLMPGVEYGVYVLVTPPCLLSNV